jgi:hypothetical protein
MLGDLGICLVIGVNTIHELLTVHKGPAAMFLNATFG